MADAQDRTTPDAPERAAIDAALELLAGDARRSLPGDVGDAIAYALAGGGKRVRGLLVLHAYRACGGGGRADALAAAVEAIHAYSLVHDDLPCMDDDDMRRGRPTLHRVYGVPVATVVGLAMIPLAARAAWRAARALGSDQATAAEIVQVLMRASGAEGMVGGQLMDLEAEGRAVSLTELEEIHRGKTGCLIAASVMVGGLAAGAGPETRRALGAFGDQVGLAFQIADDILDVTATTEMLGKTAGRDIALAKSTYPSLLGLDGARSRAAALVDAACHELRAANIRSVDLERLAQFAVNRPS
ncbi:MAG: polyprenyl synthetase family protein [Gemmatimonadetes bacterium]|nr:polyprenyl synthetase family protein [Gemmatimonadota bacterium]